MRGFDLSSIDVPTLLVDEQKCRRNIRRMALKAQKHHLQFRPHFKTHQSIEIGRWFREYGVNQITVSSLEMAEYFAKDGWNDITVAFPVNIREINRINQLAEKIQLNLLVESREVVDFLQQHLKHPVSIFIKVDVGYHRTGLTPEQKPVMDAIVRKIEDSDKLKWKGFLTHAGHTYHARGEEEVMIIHKQSLEILQQLKEYYQKKYPQIIISYGDTPSCSLATDFSGVDEIRPGNFVFYDVMQWRIGSCKLKDISVAVACPVVAKHPERQEIVIYGGAVHLSKESIRLENGETIYGIGVWLKENGWEIPDEPMWVVRLSQEHGIIKVPQIYMHRISVGDLIGVLPVHSCLTANLLQQKKLFTDENE